MNKNPFYNSLFATAYICVIATIMSNGNTIFGERDTFLTPIIVLSLLVLSASIMGYLFVGQPILLYLDGYKKEALSFFWRTVVGFAGITALVAGVSATLAHL